MPASSSPFSRRTFLSRKSTIFVEVGRPGGAVDEGDAVEQERRGEAAQDEVLHPRLLALDAPQLAGRHHVEREGERLEAEEEHDEIVGRRHDHAARGGHQHQRVDLGPVELDAAEVVVEEQRGDEHGHADDEGEEEREAVEADRAADQALGPVVLHVVPQQDGERRRDAGDDGGEDGVAAAGPAPGQERRQHHQDEPAADQREQGRERVPLDLGPDERRRGLGQHDVSRSRSPDRGRARARRSRSCPRRGRSGARRWARCGRASASGRRR